MNIPETSTKIVISAISIIMIVILLLAIIPFSQGGLTSNLEDISFNVEVKDGEFQVVGSEPITIKSTMPYDLTDVGLSVYMVGTDGQKVVMFSEENKTIRQGETLTIDVKCGTSLMDVSLILADSPNVKNGKIQLPIEINIQGYYMFGIAGVKVNLTQLIPISENGSKTTEIKSNSIECTITNLNPAYTSSLPSKGLFYIGESKIVKDQVKFTFSIDSGTLTYKIESATDTVLLDSVKKAINENGELKITDGTTVVKTLNAEETKEFVSLLEHVKVVPNE